MRLQKISLTNIRSYRNAEIYFPDSGSTLLSGDIGAGKSSILLAIEFALFGLQRGKGGEGLLRYGEKEGRVKLNFELDGKNIVVERTLKKSKDSVQQDSGTIEINNEKQQLSTKELKSKIIQMFNYPREFVDKNPILYRYTVYTPQEDMKSILLEDSDSRLNTLRRVFNIDKYKRIIENSERFISKIRADIESSKQRISEIESKKNDVEVRKGEMQKIKTEVATQSMKLDELKKIVSERKNKLMDYENKIKEYNRLKMEIASVKSELFTKKERISDDKENIEILKKQINILENELKDKKIENFSEMISKKEDELEDIEKEFAKISRESISFEINRNNASKIANDVISMKNCPTCKQEVSEKHKHDIKEKSDNEIKEINKRLEIEIKRKNEAESKISELKKEINVLRIKDRESSSVRLKFSYLDEKKKQLKKSDETKGLLEKSILALEKKKDEFESKISQFIDIEKNYEIAKRMLDEVKEEEKQYEISKARFERQLEDISSVLVILEKEIEEMERAKARMMKLSKFRSWLEDEFIQSVISIEKNVLLKLHSDFSSFFGKWFSMLANELDARIDENFSPIIEQQGYSIEYSYLSGGERTAAALAYRLALNQVINSIMSNIKTRDVLILDEPTDGFSSEQLSKMREVLNELKAEQLILVSHEEKIESFVDNVIRLEKDNSTRIV